MLFFLDSGNVTEKKGKNKNLLNYDRFPFAFGLLITLLVSMHLSVTNQRTNWNREHLLKWVETESEFNTFAIYNILVC